MVLEATVDCYRPLLFSLLALPRRLRKHCCSVEMYKMQVYGVHNQPARKLGLLQASKHLPAVLVLRPV